jgi:PAS domain S-box-containing protein
MQNKCMIFYIFRPVRNPPGVIIVKVKKNVRSEAIKMINGEREYLNKSLFEDVHDGIYRTTPDGRILTANPALVKMLGYDSEEELKSKNIGRDLYVSPKERKRLLKEIDAKGRLADVELHLKKKDGSHIIVLENSQSVCTSEGKLAYYEGTLTEITGRKLTEEALRESENRYHTLIETLQDGISLFDLNGRLLYFNRHKKMMLGYKDDKELMKVSTFEMIHPDDREKARRYFRDLMSKGAFAQKEIRILKKDKSWFWAEFSATVLKDSNGKPYLIMDSMRDVSERKKAAEELNLRVKQLRQIIDLVPSYIFAKDIDGKFLLANKALADVFGLTPDEIQGKNDSDYGATTQQIKWYRKNDLEVIKKGKPIIIPEEQVLRKDGTLGWFQTVKIPYRHPGYPKPAILGIATEITDRKSIESDLIRAKEKAEESDRLKTAFLHNISHEIRTPMNAIVGFTSLLETPGLPEDTRSQYIDIILSSSNQLLSIISDIVDISNIETGHIRLSISKTNLGEIIDKLSGQYLPRAKQAGLKLIVQTPTVKRNPEIMADETKLLQIISNLLNNSLKFTSKGSIRFGYEMKEEVVEFFVGDTGRGIKEEEHLKVFDRFYQSDVSENYKTDGTGLGLAICKGLVELMGGKIWVRSKPGKGSEFRFSVPVIKPTRGRKMTGSPKAN